MFYNWLSTTTYEQTVRVDGFRQRDLFIVTPGYPYPGTQGTISTTNRYLLGPHVQMGRVLRISAGIDQTISSKIRFNASFQSVRGADQLRGRNLNAPLNGIRLNPDFANIIQTVSDGETHSDQLSTTASVNLAGGTRNTPARLWNPRRTTFRISYWLARAHNNMDGPFVVPPSGILATEWAPAAGDRRHRYQMSLNSQALKNLNASFAVSGNTGTPYNITTGFDDNNDSIFNDRPIGVGRNSVRTSAQATVAANLTYSIGLGSAGATRAQKRAGAAEGSGQSSSRYHLVLTLAVNNLTNRPNFSGYSGISTSPFFMTPTSVMNPRKIDFGLGLRF